MPRYEYKVVPAPAKGLKGKGIKGVEARFSNAIQTLMNSLAEDGWEYQRAETLPSIERSGLTSSTTEWRNVFVFRRPRQDDTEAFTPELLPPPVVPVPAPEITPEAKTADTSEQTKEDDAPAENLTAAEENVEETTERPNATGWDNGVEDTGNVDGVSATLGSLAAARNKAKTDD